jgi:eukaryotic-like serine/threonine-protein kinase
MTGVDSLLTVGRYGIDEWLASDEMGVMFRGHDPVLDRPVAIKIVRRELTKSNAATGWLERFKRKARTGSRLFHPNILAILDYGEEDEMPFIVTEFVDGYSLDRLIKTSGSLAPKLAVTIISQVLSALEFSHENAIFHLNINPFVVFVPGGDKVKVADFGVARTDASEFTGVAEILGTPAYMAPEQLTGAPVDERTDLFTTGVLLFEMLTGTRPFLGESITEITAQMQTGTPEDVCELNPQVPDALRSVINTAFAYDPARRFATARELSLALADAVSVRGEAPTLASSPPFSPTAVEPAVQSREHEAGWDAAILRVVESDLTTYIGPIAAIAVQRAGQQATDLVDLYETLSIYIDDGKERDEFIAKGRGVDREMSRRGTSPQPERRASEWKPQQGGREEFPDRVVLDAIEARLVQHVGPIARILLEQQLQDFESVPGLCRTLADYISDDVERAAFLNWAGVN